MVVIQRTHMAAVTVGCHTKKVSDVGQPTVTAVMWIICMTTNSDGCHVDYFLTEKSYIIFQYEK